MNLDGVLFLAGETARSKAYAQAFQAHGLSIPFTVIFDGTGNQASGEDNDLGPREDHYGVILPKLTVPLQATCTAISDGIERITAASVNEKNVQDRVQQAVNDGVKLVVYSGYGGQLVSREILEIGIPFIHAHSGWLPDFPGSTTIYYSILDEGSCGVSAILLTPDIDAGPAILREHYPLPPATLDIDLIYDPAIRADLMVKALKHWTKDRNFEKSAAHASVPHHAYHVIHPVLKHLARRKVETSFEQGNKTT